jgi:uroporphyrinogen-III synthase
VRLIVTRPAEQAGAWVDELRALGLDTQALPLIEIGAVEDDTALREAWRTLETIALVVFVSANAVRHFFAASPPGAAWPDAVLAGSTGPGTSAALRAAGVGPAALVEPAEDAPSFDSESLWLRLSPRHWQGRAVLVVRGEDGRDWLAETLRGRGAQVSFVAAYRRRAPHADAAAQSLLAAATTEPAAHLWLFSSSEAVANLGALLPGADWSRSRAWASHPRIVQAARAAGFGTVELMQSSPHAVARQLATGSPIQSAGP